MTTKHSDELATKVERLVRDHLAAQQKAAAAALERAFSASFAPVPSRPVRRAGEGGRRRASDLAEIAERLLEAVRACPGETMTTIAAHLGEEARALNLPMIQLKKAGRVRSAGERNFTRYFPMTVAKAG